MYLQKATRRIQTPAKRNLHRKSRKPLWPPNRTHQRFRTHQKTERVGNCGQIVVVGTTRRCKLPVHELSVSNSCGRRFIFKKHPLKKKETKLPVHMSTPALERLKGYPSLARCHQGREDHQEVQKAHHECLRHRMHCRHRIKSLGCTACLQACRESLTTDSTASC